MASKTRGIEMGCHSRTGVSIGVSLLEVFVVILLIGMAASLVQPGWRTLTARRQVESTARMLASTLQYAFTIASLRGRTVTVCALLSDRLKEIHGCQRGPSASAWNTGMLVFDTQQAALGARYESGQHLRYMLFDPGVQVAYPLSRLRIFPNGHTMPYSASCFSVSSRSVQAQRYVKVGVTGVISVCDGPACTRRCQ